MTTTRQREKAERLASSVIKVRYENGHISYSGPFVDDLAEALSAERAEAIEECAKVAEKDGNECPGPHYDSTGWISCHYVTAESLRALSEKEAPDEKA